MFKAFIVVIEVVLLVMVLRTSFMQYWLSDIQSTVSNWMVSVAEIPDQQEISKLKARVSPQLERLSDNQKAYADTVLKSRPAIQQFNRQYCRNGDLNPFIYGETLRVVCREIARSPLSE